MSHEGRMLREVSTWRASQSRVSASPSRTSMPLWLGAKIMPK